MLAVYPHCCGTHDCLLPPCDIKLILQVQSFKNNDNNNHDVSLINSLYQNMSISYTFYPPLVLCVFLDSSVISLLKLWSRLKEGAIFPSAVGSIL